MPRGSQQCSKEGGRDNRTRLLPVKGHEAKKFHISIGKKHFYCWSGQKTGQVAQGGCGVFIPGDNAMDTALSKQP